MNQFILSLVFILSTNNIMSFYENEIDIEDARTIISKTPLHKIQMKLWRKNYIYLLKNINLNNLEYKYCWLALKEIKYSAKVLCYNESRNIEISRQNIPKSIWDFIKA